MYGGKSRKFWFIVYKNISLGFLLAGGNSEVSNEKIFTEKFVKLDSILGVPLVVLDYCEKKFKDKGGRITDKVHIKVIVNDEVRVISTASMVLARQIKEAKAKQFRAKINKVKDFYTFEGV